MIYTGPIDYFFDYKFGKLPYRSIRFEFKNLSKLNLCKQCAVYNYVDESVEFTRVIEHKYLTAQKSEQQLSVMNFHKKMENHFIQFQQKKTEKDIIL